MAAIVITVDDVRKGLTELVQEYGEDFRYTPKHKSESDSEQCLYVWNGEPDCIVGKFLHRMGVPLERLQKADSGPGMSARELLHWLNLEGVVWSDLGGVSESEQKVAYALDVAQSLQDDGSSWGVVLERTLARLASKGE